MSSAAPFGSSERESVAPLPAALPFTVDTWPRVGSEEHGRVQFLTHAHKDHTVGIEGGAEHLCCSPTTLALLRIKFPRVAARLDAGGVAFTPLNDWDTLLLHAPERLGGYAYTVTSVPLANHCQGATMLLFQSDLWGSLLHTGDCRLGPEQLEELRAALDELLGPGAAPDTLWLDSTWGSEGLVEFPDLHEAVAAVVGLIHANPGRRVLLAAENLGTEELIRGVVEATGLRAHSAPACDDSGGAGGGLGRCRCCYQTETLHRQRAAELDLLLGPRFVADDPSSRLWLIGGRGMPWLGRSVGSGGSGGSGGAQLSRGCLGPPPLIIRVSTAASLMAERERLEGAPRGAAARMPARRVVAWERGGVHFVLWARHSSRSELLAAVQALRPRTLVTFGGSLPDTVQPRPLTPDAAASAFSELIASARAARRSAAAQHEREEQQALPLSAQDDEQQQQQQEQQQPQHADWSSAAQEDDKENQPPSSGCKENTAAPQSSQPQTPTRRPLHASVSQPVTSDARKRAERTPRRSPAKRAVGGAELVGRAHSWPAWGCTGPACAQFGASRARLVVEQGGQQQAVQQGLFGQPPHVQQQHKHGSPASLAKQKETPEERQALQEEQTRHEEHSVPGTRQDPGGPQEPEHGEQRQEEEHQQQQQQPQPQASSDPLMARMFAVSQSFLSSSEDDFYF